MAVVALPDAGKPMFERWLVCEDRAIRRIMKENLRKSRLTRMDAVWTARWQAELSVVEGSRAPELRARSKS